MAGCVRNLGLAEKGWAEMWAMRPGAEAGAMAAETARLFALSPARKMCWRPVHSRLYRDR